MDDFLIYSSYAVLLLNLVLYLFSFFVKGKANVFLVSYLCFIFIMQLIMELSYYLHRKNLFVIYAFFVGQMILLGLFYGSIFKLKRDKLFVKWSLVLVLMALGVQYLIDPSQIFKFNLFEITITSLVIVLFGLLHLYNILGKNKEYYYFTIGVIFYLLASTVLFLVGNLTLNLSKDLKYLTWTLNAFLLFVYYLFILYEWKISFSSNKVLENEI